jgi:histidinol phosphatase-like enzyme
MAQRKIQIIKATLFIDIDGTIIDAAENELPFAIEKINEAYDNDYTIIITTMRGDKYFDEKSRFSKENTLKLLRRLRIKYHEIIWDSPSPRIIINDEGIGTIKHPQYSSWENYNFN